MSNKLKIILSLILLFISLTGFAQNQIFDNKWHETTSLSGNFKAVSSHPDIEVFSAPNTVMIKVNKGLEIRIFSILGKLMSFQYLEPGVYEYKLETHGIYIIKTDKTSCKIAI